MGKNGGTGLSKKCFKMCVKPFNNAFLDDRHWVFQNNSTPGHKTNITQGNILSFNVTEHCLSGNSDLNPLEYKQ